MADSAVNIKDASGATVPVDATTVPGGDFQQTVSLGDGVTAGRYVGVSGLLSLRVALTESILGSVTTGSITTSATTVGPVDVSSAGGTMVTIHGTYAGVNLTFEASDDGGTTFYPIVGRRGDAGVGELTSGVLPANTSRWWDFTVTGWNQFRVRSTAFTSGTGTVRIVPSPFLTEHLPSVNSRLVPAPVGTQTSVTSAAADTVLLAANTARLGATLYNESTATLKVLLANATSSATVYSVLIPANGYYEIPFGYTGVVKGIWSSAQGFLRVLEITAAI